MLCSALGPGKAAKLLGGSTRGRRRAATSIAAGSTGPFTTSGVTSGTYSVTEEYQIFSGTGGTNDNLTIDLSSTPVPPIPEPGSLLLVGSGLALAGLLYYRRRNKRLRVLISNA